MVKLHGIRPPELTLSSPTSPAMAESFFQVSAIREHQKKEAVFSNGSFSVEVVRDTGTEGMCLLEGLRDLLFEYRISSEQILAFDENENDTLEYSEFVELVHFILQLSSSASSDISRYLPYQVWDKDGDGQISIEEYSNALNVSMDDCCAFLSSVKWHANEPLSVSTLRDQAASLHSFSKNKRETVNGAARSADPPILTVEYVQGLSKRDLELLANDLGLKVQDIDHAVSTTLRAQQRVSHASQTLKQGTDKMWFYSELALELEGEFKGAVQLGKNNGGGLIDLLLRSQFLPSVTSGNTSSARHSAHDVLQTVNKFTGAAPTVLQLQSHRGQYLQISFGPEGMVATRTDKITDQMLVKGCESRDRNQVFQFEVAEHEFCKEVLFASSMKHYIAKSASAMKAAGHWQRTCHSDQHDERTAAIAPQKIEISEIEITLQRLTQWLQVGDINSVAMDKTTHHVRQQLIFFQQIPHEILSFLRAVSALFPGGELRRLLEPNNDGLKSIVSTAWTVLRLSAQRYPATGQYVVESSLALIIAHVPFGVRAISTLIDCFVGNAQLTDVLNANTKSAESNRLTLVKFAFEAIHQYGRISHLYQLLTEVCIDNKPYDDGKGGSETTHYKSTCVLVANFIKAHPDFLMQACIGDDNRVKVDATQIFVTKNESQIFSQENWLAIDQLPLEDFDLPTYLSEKAQLKNPSKPLPSLQVFHSGLALLEALCIDENKQLMQQLVPLDLAQSALTDTGNDFITRAHYAKLILLVHMRSDVESSGWQSWCWPCVLRCFDAKTSSEFEHKIVSMLDELEGHAATICSNSGAYKFSLQDFFEFCAQLLHLCRKIVCSQLLSGRLHTLRAIVDAILCIHQDTDALHSDACLDCFVQLCRLWKKIEIDRTKQLSANCIKQWIDSRIKTAQQTFSMLDHFFSSVGHKVDFGNLDNFIHPGIPVTIRLEALRLMDSISNSRKQLLNELESIVFFANERDPRIIVDRAEKLHQEATTNLRAVSDCFSSNCAKDASDYACITKMKSTVEQAICMLDIADDNYEAHQAIFRKIHFYRRIVSDNDQDSGVLDVLCQDRTRNKASLSEDQAALQIQTLWRGHCARERQSAAYGERSSCNLHDHVGSIAMAEQERNARAELIITCFRFLELLCTSSPENQLLLSDKRITQQLFKAAKILYEISPETADAAAFFAALCTQNPLAAVQIQSEVSWICEIAHHSENCNLVKYIELLQRLTIPENDPIGATQTLIYNILVDADGGSRDILDRAFWLLEDDAGDGTGQGIQFRHGHSGATTDNALQSRFEYHTAVLHLLADCCHKNEKISDQLRHLLPIHLFVGEHERTESQPGILNRKDDVPTAVKLGYMRLFQVLYIDPVSPKCLYDLFPTTGSVSTIDGSEISESPLECMCDGLDAFLEELVTSSPNSPMLYPSDNMRGGGIVMILTKIFESALIEMMTENEDKIAECWNKGCLWNCVDKYKTRLRTSLVNLVTGAIEDRHCQLLMALTQAMRMSAVFSADPMFESKDELAPAINAMRDTISSSGSILAETSIDTFPKFVQLARAIFGCTTGEFPWAQRRYTEDEIPDCEQSSYWWSKDRDAADDGFEFPRCILHIVLDGAANDARRKESIKANGKTDTHSHGQHLGNIDGHVHAHSTPGYIVADEQHDRGPSGPHTIENVKGLIDTCSTYPHSLNVEAVLMGFNGALLRQAMESGNMDGAALVDASFIAPATIKDSLATEADACRLLSAFLKNGVGEHIVSRAARFGTLLFQGNDDPEFSSAAAVKASLHLHQMQAKRVSRINTRMTHGMMQLMHSYINNSDGSATTLRATAGTRILRVLQLLCENQCYQWQNELGVSDSGTDVVTRVSQFYAQFARDVRENSPSAAAMRSMADDDLRIQALDSSLLFLLQFCETLTEFILGPHSKNQRRVLDAEINSGERVLECVPLMLQWLQTRQSSLLRVSDAEMSETRQKTRRARFLTLLKVELGTLELVDGILEGYTRRNFMRVTRMFLHNAAGHDNGFVVLLKNLTSHHLADANWKGDKFSEERSLCEDLLIRYFVIVSKLKSYDRTARFVVEKFLLASPAPRAAMRSAQTNVVQVQIKVHGRPAHYSAPHAEFDPRQLFQLLYFAVPTASRGMTRCSLATSFFQTLFDRDVYLDMTWRERQEVILRGMFYFMDVHDHQMVFNNSKALRTLQWLGTYIAVVQLFLTVCINALLLYGSSESSQSGAEWVEVDTKTWIDIFPIDFRSFIFDLFSKVHVVCSVITLTNYMSQMPLINAKRVYRDALVPEGGANRCGRMGSSFWKLARASSVCFGSIETVYRILALIASLMGAMWDSFFFSFHTLEFFFVTEISRLLLSVVVTRFSQLMVTIFLCLILTYVYAALGWKLVAPNFAYGFSDLPDLSHSYVSPNFHAWALAHFEHGIRDGPRQMLNDAQPPLEYVILSTSYYIVIILLIGAIIQGIVIDEFADKRDKASEMHDLTESYDSCTGLSDVSFENIGIPFDDFVEKYRHQSVSGKRAGIPVAYMELMIYLSKKPRTEMSGIEIYVRNLIDNNDSSFFPLVSSKEEENMYLKLARKMTETDTQDEGDEHEHMAGTTMNPSLVIGNAEQTLARLENDVDNTNGRSEDLNNLQMSINKLASESIGRCVC